MASHGAKSPPAVSEGAEASTAQRNDAEGARWRGQAANVEVDLRHRVRRFDEKSARHFAVLAVS